MIRQLLTATTLLVLTMPTAMGAEGQGEVTVRVLVPTDNLGLQSDNDRLGWTRLELPGAEGADEALQIARDRFGDDVILERIYRLGGQEDEPFFGDQWLHANTGQTGGTADADIDTPTAWGVSSGSGVVVAVVDSGVDSAHPDLTGMVIPGWDTVDDDADPSPVGVGSDEAHATLVAGVVAASVNGAGVVGVAYESAILNYRACSSGNCWSLDVADAIFRAVDAGSDVINLSLGSPGVDDPPLEVAIEYALDNDVLVVAAAGNNGSDIDSLPAGEIMIPADLPYSNIIAVGASDHDDAKPSYSNYGLGVDVFAPGDFILTTGAAGEPDYVYGSGSSFAAPVVSGIAALLLADDPGIAHQELKARIEELADQPASLSGLSSHGRVNAGSTLTIRFVDTASSVFVNAIDWIEDRSITEGCNPPYNSQYCPGGNVTRGEMAVFFARAFNLSTASDDYFDDDAGRFFEGAANRMFEAGITVGCGGNNYCGDREITRGELAAMLARVLSLPPASSDHFDDDTGSLFENAINKIAEAGITNGCNPPTNNHFCPADDVTRGEMAAFIKRAMEHLGQ